ncbi:MAG: hypothetical protein QM572_11760 [Nocardioides sp.]|uniref:hypothetical protein n=1 Tax=Nocardioides sp. TaxID=35761 RepID=UPI0039E715F5
MRRPALLVGLLAVIGLLVATTGLDTGSDGSGDTGLPSTAVTATASPGPVEAATFCASYAKVADAYSEVMSAGSDDAIDRLRRAAIGFVSVGTPPGMSTMQDAGRLWWIRDLLKQYAPQPTPSPDSADLVQAQSSAFSGFLTTECPGY